VLDIIHCLGYFWYVMFLPLAVLPSSVFDLSCGHQYRNKFVAVLRKNHILKSTVLFKLYVKLQLYWMDTNQNYTLQNASLGRKSGNNFIQNPFSIASDVCRQMDRHDLPIMRSCCALHEESRSHIPNTFSSSVGTSSADVRASLLCTCHSPRCMTYCTLPVVGFGQGGVWLFLARKESCDVVTGKPGSSKHGL
jgi:hypothetical protein